MKKQEKHSFIQETARTLLASKGVAETSMEDIALAANYTRRTLYSYFKSQQDVFMQVFIVDLDQRWQKQKHAMEGAKTGLEKLLAWANTLYSFAKKNPQAMQLQAYWDYKGVAPERINDETFKRFKYLNDDIANGLRAVFNQGIKDGSINPTINVDMTISHFIYSHRAVMQRAMDPAYSFAKFEADDYVDTFLRTFIRGIKPT